MTASVISLAERRPLSKLVAESSAAERTAELAARVEANKASRIAWETTPRGRFVDALSKLASLGLEDTADRVTWTYRGGGEGRGFQREDFVPDPRSLGAAFGILASIPSSDPLAHRQARAAVAALVEIAGLIEPSFPTQPECA